MTFFLFFSMSLLVFHTEKLIYSQKIKTFEMIILSIGGVNYSYRYQLQPYNRHRLCVWSMYRYCSTLVIVLVVVDTVPGNSATSFAQVHMSSHFLLRMNVTLYLGSCTKTCIND